MQQVRRKVMIQKTVLWGIRAGFFYHFPKYHIEIILGDFNPKVWRYYIFKPKFGMGFYIRIVMIMVLE